MGEQVDTLIVGAGAMGLAAAWQLAERGREVLVVDRFTRGNECGASHGATRNFNQAYADPGYVSMLVEAEQLWLELESRSGRVLLERTGIVNHGDNTGFDTVRSALTFAGIPAKILPAEEASRRWPGIRFETQVLFAPESGRLLASEALEVLEAAAIAAGAEFRWSTEATGIAVQGEDRVLVGTPTGTITARRVIVTAGAWTKGLLGGLVVLPRLAVTQEQPAHFAESVPGLAWPGFNHNPDRASEGYDYWLSPVYGLLTPGEGIKVGWHGVGPVTDPDARDFTAVPAQLTALRRYVSEWLPGADADRFIDISCTYTTTPDANFLLRQEGPITIGAGFSGHGFKFTPAIGRILADMSEGSGSAPTLNTVPF